MRLRAFSLGAGLVLAGATLVAVPVPAQAATLTDANAQASRNVNEVGPATCNVTNSNSMSQGAFTTGAPATYAASGTTTLVDQADNPGDTVTIPTSVTTKVRATEAGGQLSSLHLDGVFTGSVNATQGAATDCDAQIQLSSVTGFKTDLTTGRWMRVEAEVPVGTIAQLIFVRTVPASPPHSAIVVLAGSAKGHSEAELFLEPGSYTATVFISTSWSSPQSNSDPTSFSYTPSLHLDWLAPGTAVEKAVGTGTAFATLENGRDCAKNRLTGKLLKAAGTKDEPALKKAIFKVNGKRAQVLKGKKAVKNAKVTLKGLPSDQDVEVRATFKKVGGGSASFTREYFSCT
jgi:hypothetical protein